MLDQLFHESLRISAPLPLLMRRLYFPPNEKASRARYSVFAWWPQFSPPPLRELGLYFRHPLVLHAQFAAPCIDVALKKTTLRDTEHRASALYISLGSWTSFVFESVLPAKR